MIITLVEYSEGVAVHFYKTTQNMAMFFGDGWAAIKGEKATMDELKQWYDDN